MRMPLTIANLCGRIEAIQLLAIQVADSLAFHSMDAAAELREAEDVCEQAKRTLRKEAARAAGGGEHE